MLGDPPRLVASLLGLVLVGSGAAARAQPPSTPELSLTSVALNVTDLARSETFYSEVLGLQRTGRFPAEGKLLEVILGQPGKAGGMGVILAHFNDDPLPEGSVAYGRIVVVTKDAKAVAKLAVDAGYKAPRTVSVPGNAVVLFIEDPDGYPIELYQPATPAN